MGKGTVISNGQGDEKKVYIIDAVTDESGKVKAAAGTVSSPFKNTSTAKITLGQIFDLTWDATASCVSLDASKPLDRAQGTCNNSGGKSTVFTPTTPGASGWRSTDRIAIQTGADTGGDANSGFAGQTAVYGAPVLDGAGFLSRTE